MNRPALKQYPDRAGVYLFKDAKSRVLYVGKALSLKSRLSSYFQKTPNEKIKSLISKAISIGCIETGSEFEALLLEERLIKKYRPHFNVALKDDKSYLYIFISVYEEFPKVYRTRKPKNLSEGASKQILYDQKGLYFGPYPSSYTIKLLLKQLRKIFPFCQQKNDKRPCFYSHIGLCNPCPANIVAFKGSNPVEFSHLKLKYRYNVLHLRRVLEGKLVGVKKDLEKQMKLFSKTERFEEASQIKNKLNYLQMMTRQSRISQFMENSNFYFEQQASATHELRQLLLPYFPGLPEIKKIECFDVSHFSGSFTAGSMVVFTSGVPEKNLYKRFKIRHPANSDVDSLHEMVARRLLHPEWEFPEILLIDGGKSQVSKIVALCKEMHIQIPVAGLAKRWEELIIFDQGTFISQKLPQRNAALMLLQQMRDEAHRFAVSYHRHLRKYSFD